MSLHYIIFEEGATLDALMAPIQARVRWGKRSVETLFKTKEVMPYKKKYGCLLCPVGTTASTGMIMLN